MQSYTANFPGVVGLIGSDSELSVAQDACHVIAERRDIGGADYLLDHTAAIYLVNRARQIQLAYPYGTDPTDLVADLRKLVDTAPASRGSASQTETTTDVRTGLVITHAWARAADVGGTTAVYLRIENSSVVADRLIGSTSSVGDAQIHRTSDDGGGMVSNPADCTSW